MREEIKIEFVLYDFDRINVVVFPENLDKSVLLWYGVVNILMHVEWFGKDWVCK